jgi:hypothetical protein
VSRAHDVLRELECEIDDLVHDRDEATKERERWLEVTKVWSFVMRADRERVYAHLRGEHEGERAIDALKALAGDV